MNLSTRTPWPERLWSLADAAGRGLQSLQPLALLAARVYVALVFFRSGLTKLRDWDITLALFQDEYRVPLLDPVLAAYAGTAAELVLPALLAIGLTGRFAAAGLSVLNVVAVLSLAEISEAALQGHVFWGSLLLGVLLWGPGRWSLDAWFMPWLRTRFGGGQAVPHAGYTAPSPMGRPASH